MPNSRSTKKATKKTPVTKKVKKPLQEDPPVPWGDPEVAKTTGTAERPRPADLLADAVVGGTPSKAQPPRDPQRPQEFDEPQTFADLNKRNKLPNTGMNFKRPVKLLPQEQRPAKLPPLARAELKERGLM